MAGRVATRTSVRVPLTFVRLRANFGWILEYADTNPISQASVPLMERGEKGKFAKWMGNVRQPLEQRIRDKQNGVGRQRRPYIGESNEAAPVLEWLLDADQKIRSSVCVYPGHVGRPHLRAGVQRKGTGQSFLVQGGSF